MHASSPEELSNLLCEAVNAADIEAVLQLYEPGAVLVRPSGIRIHGSDAIREATYELLQLRPRMTFEASEVARHGDIALFLTEWSLVGIDDSGALVQRAGVGTEVARRQQDGSWRYVIDDPGSVY